MCTQSAWLTCFKRQLASLFWINELNWSQRFRSDWNEKFALIWSVQSTLAPNFHSPFLFFVKPLQFIAPSSQARERKFNKNLTQYFISLSVSIIIKVTQRNFCRIAGMKTRKLISEREWRRQFLFLHSFLPSFFSRQSLRTIMCKWYQIYVAHFCRR